MEANIILPPLEKLNEAAATLIDQATDASQERSINKALWHLQGNIEIRSTTNAFLMPSGTKAGVIHRISHAFGCDCQAAARGLVCWHASAIAIVEEAQRHTMPALRRNVTRAQALAEINELF